MIQFLIELFMAIFIGFVIFQYFQSYKVRSNKDNYSSNNEYLKDYKRTEVDEMFKFGLEYIKMNFKNT